MVLIDWNNKTILDCSSSIVCDLYNEIENVIDNSQKVISNKLQKLISHLEAAYGGIGLDLADYIDSKEDLNDFIDLVTRALKQCYIKHPTYLHASIYKLEQFRYSLLEIEKEFPQ